MNSTPDQTVSDAPVIGIDFGGTSVKIGLCRGADALIAVMCDAIDTLKKNHPGVGAVGVGVPGLVDHRSGFVREITNVPGWLGVPFAQILTEKTRLVARVDNDANCMTYAEFRYGAGVGVQNMIAVTLGTGVGGGLVLDGQLYHGARSGAGEIGQMSIDFEGKPGTYGNTGALEEYVGNNEIAARAKYLYQREGIEQEAKDCSPAALSAAAHDGDAVALQIWNEIATMLSCGLANCIWLLNPGAIIIGGGVSKAGSLLLRPLRTKIRTQLADTFCSQLRIEPAKFGNDAGMIGSAAIARDALTSS